MAAVELSLDKDWLRYRLSFFYASGDKDPRDGTARGFDTIFDNPNFAGGFFSFWNREGIRLTSTGVGLVSPDSLVPDLRTSKTEGQANFVNPGLFLYNAGVDIDITPKLRGFVNLNLLRFARTDPLELLLFQSNIHAGIGADSGIGFTYRPPLSENIVITGGVERAGAVPGSSRHLHQSSFVHGIYECPIQILRQSAASLVGLRLRASACACFCARCYSGNHDDPATGDPRLGESQAEADRNEHRAAWPVTARPIRRRCTPPERFVWGAPIVMAETPAYCRLPARRKAPPATTRPRRKRIPSPAFPRCGKVRPTRCARRPSG